MPKQTHFCPSSFILQRALLFFDPNYIPLWHPGWLCQEIKATVQYVMSLIQICNSDGCCTSETNVLCQFFFLFYWLVMGLSRSQNRKGIPLQRRQDWREGRENSFHRHLVLSLPFSPENYSAPSRSWATLGGAHSTPLSNMTRFEGGWPRPSAPELVTWFKPGQWVHLTVPQIMISSGMST